MAMLLKEGSIQNNSHFIHKKGEKEGALESGKGDKVFLCVLYLGPFYDICPFIYILLSIESIYSNSNELFLE